MSEENPKNWFKPGNQYGKLAGRVKKNTAHRKITVLRRMGAEEFAEIVQVLLTGNVQTLEYLARNKDRVEPLKAMIASVALRCIERGDYGALNALLDRLVGKPRETIEVKATQENRLEELKAAYSGLLADPETAGALRLLAERSGGVESNAESSDHKENLEQYQGDTWESNTIETSGEPVGEADHSDIIEET